MGKFQKVLKASCEVSSMKTLPRIVRASSSFQLMLWILALICGLAFGGYQVVMLINQYLNYPTSVDNIEISASPPFPAVTVCHQDPDWTAKRLEIEFGEAVSRSKYREKVRRIMKRFPSGTYMYSVAHYLKDSFGGYLQNINISDKEIENLKHHLVVDCTIVHFLEKRPLSCFMSDNYNVFLDPVFGMCITIEDHQATELNMILYLDGSGHESFKEFRSTDETHLSGVGARLIIHPHGSYPDVNYFSQHVLPGREYDVDLTARERVFLGEPYGNCVEPRPAEEAGRQRYEIYRHGYECYRMCSKHKILDECGCLHVYYNHEENNITLCGHVKDDDILMTVSHMNCAEKTMAELELDFTEKCYCPKPCQEFEHDYTTETMPWPHFTYHLSFYKKHIQGSSQFDDAKFHIYDELIKTAESNKSAALEQISQIGLIENNFARVRVLNHQWKYLKFQETPMLSIESMIGSVGGLCNMWAGITFLTLIEIVELVYQWLSQGNISQNKHNPNPNVL